jgi:ankyrin repeat protein
MLGGWGTCLAVAADVGADAPGGAEKAPADLWEAAERGDVAAVRKFIASGARVDELDDAKQWTPLIYAVRYNQLDAARALLEANANPLKSSGKGSFPIGFAAQYGHVEMIKLLASKGADLDRCKAPFYIPLAYAAQYGKLDAIDALLDAGARVEAADQAGRTALMIASAYGQTKAMQKLLDRGGDAEAATPDGATAVVMAAHNGHVEALKLLAKSGGNLRHPFAIYHAAKNGHPDVVLYLIDVGGVDPNVGGEDRNSILSLACERGDRELMTQLMNRGAAWYQGDEGLKAAIERGHHQCAQLAMDVGARVDEETCAELFAKALAKGDPDMLLVMLRLDRRVKRAKPSAIVKVEDELVRAAASGDAARIGEILAQNKLENDQVFRSANATAQARGHKQAAAVLTKAGEPIIQAADTRAQQASALVNAAQKKDLKAVTELLAKGVPPDSRDGPGGRDAMFWAEGPKGVEIARMLLEKGYPPNGGRGMVYPSIRAAAIDEKAGVERARLYLKYGADPNLTWDRIYPLEVFASRGNLEGVKLLLDVKARIDQRGHQGRTALIAAAEEGATDVAKLLIQRGADVNVANDDGVTALGIARALGHEDVIKALRAAGANDRPGAIAAAARRGVLIEAFTRGPDEVQRLIKSGVDPNQWDLTWDSTPLQFGVASAVFSSDAPEKRLAIVRTLLDNGVNPRDYPGILVSAIYARTQDKDHGVPLIRLLIERGADVNAGGDWASGYNPLLMAADRGNAQAVQLLLAQGASSEVRKDTGETPLDLAIKHGHKEATILLKRDEIEWKLRRGEK